MRAEISPYQTVQKRGKMARRQSRLTCCLNRSSCECMMKYRWTRGVSNELYRSFPCPYHARGNVVFERRCACLNKQEIQIHGPTKGKRDAPHRAHPTLDRLHQFDVRRALAAIAAGFKLVRHFLVVCQAGQARTLDGADVDENVLAARFRCDEAEAFCGVEPFHGAIGHIRGLLFYVVRIMRQPGVDRLGSKDWRPVKEDSGRRRVAIARVDMGYAQWFSKEFVCSNREVAEPCCMML